MSQELPIPPAAINKHFQVANLSADLKHKSTRGGAIMVAGFALQLVIGVVGTAILARLLEPRDFGYLAMVMTLTSFIFMFREFLLTPAVQAEQLTHEQASGLFWINAVASLAIGGFVAAMAPVLVWFFNEPRLLWITLIMSIGIVLNMLSMLHVGLLRRQMRFTAISVIEIGAVVAGMIVGIGAALLGQGYWALVHQQMAIWVWQGLTPWIVCSWRPASRRASLFHGDASVRSMLHYGKDTTAARVIMYIGRNVDAVLVGHFFGAALLGLYQKAFLWAMMPFWQIYIPMTGVAVASFSRLQGDPLRYRHYARITLLGLFGLSLPAMAMIVVIADNVVLLLFGNKWLGAIPMLQILSVGAYFSSFSTITSWLYLPEGRAREQLQWSLIATPLNLIAIVAGTKWGTLGVAGGFTIAMILQAFPAVWFCLRGSPITVQDFIGAIWRPATASINAAILLALLRYVLPPLTNPLWQLSLHGIIFCILYITTWLIIPGGRASWQQFLDQVRGAHRRAPATLDGRNKIAS